MKYILGSEKLGFEEIAFHDRINDYVVDEFSCMTELYLGYIR